MATYDIDTNLQYYNFYIISHYILKVKTTLDLILILRTYRFLLRGKKLIIIIII